MNKTVQAIIGASVGVIFMSAILYVSVHVECPSASLLFTMRVILAIAVAAFSMVISGTLKFKQKGLISASGSIGVFVLIYLINPADGIDSKKCNQIEFVQFSGRVTVNGKVNPDIKLKFSGGNIQGINSPLISRHGQFNLKFSKEQFVEGHYFFEFLIKQNQIALIDKILDKNTDSYIDFNLELPDSIITIASVEPTIKNTDSSNQEINNETKTTDAALILEKGQQLEIGLKYYSNNKAYYLLASEKDGDLSVYNGNNELHYHLRTSGAYYVKLQEDGNFCLYDEYENFLWCAFTQEQGYKLKLSNNGLLFVESKDGEVVWQGI